MSRRTSFPNTLPDELFKKCRAYAQQAYQDWLRRKMSYVLVDDDNLERREGMPDYDDSFEWARSEYTGHRKTTGVSGQGWMFPTYEEAIKDFCGDQVREYVVTESSLEEFDELLDEYFCGIEELVNQCYVEAIGAIQGSPEPRKK